MYLFDMRAWSGLMCIRTRNNKHLKNSISRQNYAILYPIGYVWLEEHCR